MNKHTFLRKLAPYLLFTIPFFSCSKDYPFSPETQIETKIEVNYQKQKLDKWFEKAKQEGVSLEELKEIIDNDEKRPQKTKSLPKLSSALNLKGDYDNDGIFDTPDLIAQLDAYRNGVSPTELPYFDHNNNNFTKGDIYDIFSEVVSILYDNDEYDVIFPLSKFTIPYTTDSSISLNAESIDNTTNLLYLWYVDDNFISSEKNTSVSLNEGQHKIKLETMDKSKKRMEVRYYNNKYFLNFYDIPQGNKHSLEKIINVNKKWWQNNFNTKKEFTMAFILVGREGEEISQSYLNDFHSFSAEFPEIFKEATLGLVNMETSDYIIYISNNIVFSNYIDSPVIMKEFYKKYPDDFDFSTIYTTFAPIYTTLALRGIHFNPVKNNIENIGKSIFDTTELFGSKGRLMGVNVLGNSLDYFDHTSQGKIDLMNIILHETGHWWGVYLGDNFGTNGIFEIKTKKGHFYEGLESPYETGSVMYSSYFVQNQDETYRQRNIFGVRKYHPFMLYFMGVLPSEYYDEKYNVYNMGIGDSFNYTNATIYKKISVNDIISVYGERYER